MPLIQINAGPDGPELHGTSRPIAPVLQRALGGAGPVIIMIHGFKFRPGHPDACPHGHILSLTPAKACRKALSWPRALGIGQGDPDEGLAIAFGWDARGTIWQAWRRAARAGAALAALLAAIHRIDPARPVHALAHSLGARVILRALCEPGLPSGSLSRAILLSGAEFGSHAAEALYGEAGRQAEIINVTSRENDLFDFMLERLIAPPVRGDGALGFCLPDAPNALTLQLDHPQTRTALAQAGFPISAPRGRVCHWSTYLQPGVFDLYRALLRRADDLPLPHLRAALPERYDPRWSRLRAWQPPSAALPMGQKASF